MKKNNQQEINLNQKFDFWKDNKLANHYQLTLSELIYKFKVWLQKQDMNYLNNYNTDRIVRNFITSNESTGLRSVFDEKQYEGMFKHFQQALTQYEKENLTN